VSFGCPNVVYFGQAQLERLGAEAKNLGASRALIVTDQEPGAPGLSEQARAALAGEGITARSYAGVNTERRWPTSKRAWRHNGAAGLTW